MGMYWWTVHLTRNNCHNEEESLQSPKTRRQRTIENTDTYIEVALYEVT